jgi:hypothetical protein
VKIAGLPNFRIAGLIAREPAEFKSGNPAIRQFGNRVEQNG